MKKITKIITSMSVVALWLATATNAQATTIIEDFESGPAGIFSFNSGSSVAFSITDNSPADMVPGASAGNNVLKIEVAANNDPIGFGGIAYDFAIPRDWSAYSSLSFWLYGTGNGNNIFADIREDANGNPSCCAAEIWKSTFTDDVAGWSLVELDFSSFSYVIGAENPAAATQSLDLSQVRGWAFGYADGISVDSVYYLDNVTVVPEPTNLILFGLGIAGLVVRRRKKA